MSGLMLFSSLQVSELMTLKRIKAVSHVMLRLHFEGAVVREGTPTFVQIDFPTPLREKPPKVSSM